MINHLSGVLLSHSRGAPRGEKRPAGIPQIPEIPPGVNAVPAHRRAEAGVKDCEISGWNALIAPAGTPPLVLQRLHEEVARIMRLEDIKAKFADLGVDAIGSTPEELAAFLRAEMTKWAEVVKAADIRIE